MKLPVEPKSGSAIFGAAGLAAALLLAASASAEPVVYARDLALSPDGQTLAFAWAGDLWLAPAEGGTASRLTAHPADDSRPVWSHDGAWIAFASNRTGSNCVYVMTREGDGLRRLTYSDQVETPSSFSHDDRYVYFHARKNGEVDWETRVYQVPVTGGQATRLLDCGASYAAPDPDGRLLVFTRGQERWWRSGYRGSANWDLWLFDRESRSFRQLTDFAGTDFMPVWDRSGDGVYFLSDRSGVHNVWYQPLQGAPRAITAVSGDRVRDYSVSGDGRLLVYAQWDRLFSMTLPGGTPREIRIDAPADSAADLRELRSYSNDADELALSPDGRQFAVVVRGEIFVGQTEPDQLTRRVTNSAARDRHVAWSPDGEALFFVSDAAGQEDIYRAISGEEPPKALCDSLRFRVERITDHPEIEQAPAVSPDGRQLAYIRGLGHLIVRELETGREHTLLEAWNWPEFRWSPDSRWIAYAVADAEYNSDVWIVPADGSAPAVNITRHPDNDSGPQWSADGQVLAFSSQRDGFDTDLYLVFLSPSLDEKSGVDLGNYFRKAGEAAGKAKPLEKAIASGKIALAGEPAASRPAETQPAEKTQEKPGELSLEERLRSLIRELLKEPGKKDKEEKSEPVEKHEYDLASAWQRIRRVTTLPADQSSFALSPDGAALAFVSRHEGEPGVFVVRWNGSELKRIASGAADALQWDLPGKRLYLLSGGTPTSLTAAGGDRKTHSFEARMIIDRGELAAQKFDDAARMLGLRFYHPALKGLNWPALTAKYRELALKTRTWSEFNEIFNLLQGELNASHLGISGPPGRGGATETIGYLGCDFEPDFPGPGLKVRSVTRNSPADRSESRLVPGDVILRVDGQPVGPDASIEAALVDTAGKPILLAYLPSPTRQAAPGSQAASGPSTAPASTAAASPPGASAPATRPAEAELVIRPVGYGEFRRLQYVAWVEANRRYVEERSGGRVAYAHISGMGEPQFYEFERDLYAAAHGKEGLIVDVRNNGGGWTADWVLAVLNVRRHAYTVGRGGQPGYPQDRLIFYSWPKPATMMCNQFSYSNAEIVSHAFKNLGRGPLVGMTTWGAVISTGSYGLIDGSSIRMPFRGWYTIPGGIDMELNGAEPDVKVPLLPQDEQAGRDPQLDAAIEATLRQLPPPAQPAGPTQP